MTFHIPRASHRPDTAKTKVSISVILLAFLALMGAAMSPAGATHSGVPHGSGEQVNIYDRACGMICGGQGDGITPIPTYEPCISYSNSTFAFAFTDAAAPVNATATNPVTAVISLDTVSVSGTPKRYEGPNGTYAGSDFGGTAPNQGCLLANKGATIAADTTSTVAFRGPLGPVLPCASSNNPSVTSIRRVTAGYNGPQTLTIVLTCPSGTPATLTITGKGFAVDPPCVPLGMPLACPITDASIS